MQIKTTMRYHLILFRMTISEKNLQTINAGDGVEKRKPSYTVGRNAKLKKKKKEKKKCKIVKPLEKTLWRFLKNPNLELPSVQFSH